MQVSNERLTTATGSATEGLIESLCSERLRANQFVAMKIDKPKSVRWCSDWSTPIKVQNQGW